MYISTRYLVVDLEVRTGDEEHLVGVRVALPRNPARQNDPRHHWPLNTTVSSRTMSSSTYLIRSNMRKKEVYRLGGLKVIGRAVWGGGVGGEVGGFVRAPDEEFLIHAGNDPCPVPVSTASTTYALHAESLPAPGLPVGEDGRVKACLLVTFRTQRWTLRTPPPPVKCWL